MSTVSRSTAAMRQPSLIGSKRAWRLFRACQSCGFVASFELRWTRLAAWL